MRRWTAIRISGVKGHELLYLAAQGAQQTYNWSYKSGDWIYKSPNCGYKWAYWLHSNSCLPRQNSSRINMLTCTAVNWPINQVTTLITSVTSLLGTLSRQAGPLAPVIHNWTLNTKHLCLLAKPLASFLQSTSKLQHKPDLADCCLSQDVRK